MGGRNALESALSLADLTTAELSRFVLGTCAGKRRSAGTVQVMAGALRCYLRFRGLTGDPIGALADTIPVAAHWRLASFPDVLSPAEIEQLLLALSVTPSLPASGPTPWYAAWSTSVCVLARSLACSWTT
jgi:hypothetical protein